MKSSDANQRRQIVIVTGLSGAGKTSVMRALEDQGFYCVDNLPVPLLATFLTLAFQAQAKIIKVALGIDARGSQFLDSLLAEMDTIRKDPVNLLKIIFLNANENTLFKRFQETRRKHPLAQGISIENAIKKEKKILEPIMNMADMVLDTDVLNIHELRNWVRAAFEDSQSRELLVNIVSFGFKYGLPADSNLVYDLRFLPNPYFIPELKKMDGRQKEVREYLFNQESVTDYWSRLSNFLEHTLQKYYTEGRYIVTVSVGCTGGKHRSVAFVEKIAEQKWGNIKFIKAHRDVDNE